MEPRSFGVEHDRSITILEQVYTRSKIAKRAKMPFVQKRELFRAYSAFLFVRHSGHAYLLCHVLSQRSNLSVYREAVFY